MGATLLDQSTPYTLFDNRAWLFLPAVAHPMTAVTRLEINAGHDLSGEIISVEGFTTSTDMLDIPRANRRAIGKTPGRIQLADSSITFYLSREGTDVRDLLTQDLEGFVVIMDEGDEQGNHMDCWPVTITSPAKSQDVEALASIQIMFATTDEPGQDLVVPAAA